MTPEDIKAIRDAEGGTKAMAERLEVTTRAVRYLCPNAVPRPRLEREIRRLVSTEPGPEEGRLENGLAGLPTARRLL